MVPAAAEGRARVTGEGAQKRVKHGLGSAGPSGPAPPDPPQGLVSTWSSFRECARSIALDGQDVLERSQPSEALMPQPPHHGRPELLE
jgi:hypothetical protein